MLRNTVQVLVAFGLFGAAVCPCLAQTLLVEDGAQHAHSSGHHQTDSMSLPKCHGGENETACAGASATMGEVADSISGNGFQFDDDDASDPATFEPRRPDLTHHGGSPPANFILIAGSPVTRHDRLIE